MLRAAMRRCIAWAILCACLLNLSATAFEALQGFRKSPVAAAAIVVGKTLETCHHHPQGCPKSCLCPKTRVSLETSEARSSGGSGSLQETSWVNCSEEGSSAPAGLFALTVVEPSCRIILPSPRGFRRAEAGIALLEAHPSPLQKIPIV